MENDSRHLSPVPADGKCECGGASFTLAQDSTTYTPGHFFLGGRVYSGGYRPDVQPSDAEGSLRFFCAQCGEQYQVPEKLQ